jgi:chromosome segregation ATPase
MNPETLQAMKEVCEPFRDEPYSFRCGHCEMHMRNFRKVVTPGSLSALIAEVERLRAEFEAADKQMAAQCNEAYQKRFVAQQETARVIAERDALAAEVERQAGEIEELNKHIADLNHDLEATIKHCNDYHE